MHFVNLVKTNLAKMKTTPFIGRTRELSLLNSLLLKSSASLIVIKGRRRIGKSRLVEEFGKQFDQVCLFSGIPPHENTTREQQCNLFGQQLKRIFDVKPSKTDEWDDLFFYLAQHTNKGKVLILLDEISWLGSKDHDFLGKLKNAWDLNFKKNPQLVLVLCGSVSTWIEKNILNSTGFFGRISMQLTLEELPLNECNQFWLKQTDNIAPYEKFKVLAVTGGVPKYLEEIKPTLSAEENIRLLCFEKFGQLFNEFDKIFADIFSDRHVLYQAIVKAIADKSSTYEEIYTVLGVEKSGIISTYLEDLIKSGFIERDFIWHLKTGKVSKLSKFRISDNYLRFYIKYILPNKDKIERGTFGDTSLTLMPQWESIMGLQFENLVLHNRRAIHKILGIKPEEIIYDNPFFQRKTAQQEACQIDYLIQTRFDSLYVCEIKFSRHPVKTDVIAEVEEKIKRLKTPRHVSRRSVLIHVNGVTDDVLERQYFSQIVDFGQLLYES